MDLVIDVGNTFQKVAIFTGKGDLFFDTLFSELQVDDIAKLLEIHTIENTIFSSVTHDYPEIIALLQTKTNYLHFTHTAKLPITIDYDSPHTLGLDRIANAVAAHKLFPKENVLSIQTGSCLVFDFIDRHAHFHGGAISPGLSMRFNALHHFTRRLPLPEKNEIPPLIGKSTQHSIQSGVINGIIHEINETIRQYLQYYPDLQVILSGGDSDYLQKSIKNAIFAGSKFVLKGLHEILKFNVEN